MRGWCGDGDGDFARRRRAGRGRRRRGTCELIVGDDFVDEGMRRDVGRI